MTARLAVAAVAASLALSGCATKLTAADGAKLLKSAHDNGCSGTVLLDVRGSTGQLGGSASGQFTLNGKCDPAAAPGLVVGQAVGQAPPVVTTQP